MTDDTKIGLLGLGGLTSRVICGVLAHPGFRVQAFDADGVEVDALPNPTIKTGLSSKEVAAFGDVLIYTASNDEQLELDLFHPQSGVLSVLPKRAILLVASSHLSTGNLDLPQRVAESGRQDIGVLDIAVVSGSKESSTQNPIFLSGDESSIKRAAELLSRLPDPVITVSGGFGVATKVALVHQLLSALHVATAAEAMGLAAKAGLDTKATFAIISNAAGSSSAFNTRVPVMLDGNFSARTPLNSALQNIKTAVSKAKCTHCPLPLAGMAEQLFVSAAAHGYEADDDAGLVRTYLPGNPNMVQDSIRPNALEKPLTPSCSPFEISKIGMIGLGAMGQGMAGSLVRAGFAVQGYDIYEPAVEKFTANGTNATGARTPAEAIRGSDVVLLMVQNAAQAEDILFQSGKGAEALSDGAVVILSSTVPPQYTRDLDAKLKGLGKGITLVDAPVSGGVVRAANGTLTIICSGEDIALSKVNGALLAMTGGTRNLCPVEGGIGAASSVKLVNQLLAGVHIAAAAEAMAFAARLDLNTRMVFHVLKSTGAWSWMLENRVPQMLDADWTPHSALAIFVKDLGIVLDEAARLKYFAPISAAAHSLYISGAAHGWSKESDAGVVRLWEMAGASVVSKAGAQAAPTESRDTKEEATKDTQNPLPAQSTLDSLPKEYGAEVLSDVRRVVEQSEVPTLVVLDDDPTGTQTCHDIDVLTVWDDDTLDSEFNLNPSGFFILTNSRALPSAEARNLIQEICENVSRAAKKANKTFEIVLRGDSTLRGHLPEEPEAAETALGLFDGWVIAPFFAQGGRYTIDDVHYVKEGDVLIPASETPFAKDATFGYKNSNLRLYVLEKCGDRFNESSFLSVTLNDIRNGGPSAVTKKLLSVPVDPNRVVIVNAVAESDMHVFVAGLLEAEKSGRRYLYRTAAAFVSSRLGIKGIPPLTMEDLGVKPADGKTQPGGLIIAGSYVPKTTAQLQVLKERRGAKLHVIELQVPELISSKEAAASLIDSSAAKITKSITEGRDVLVMTSRELVKGHDGLSSLNIGSQVARALVELVEKIEVRPRYIIAKGGITSSDTATKGLKMRRARILGQAAPGVPLWRCTEEPSRHRGVPYVVFPGNVGSDSTLAEVVESWAVTETT